MFVLVLNGTKGTAWSEMTAKVGAAAIELTLGGRFQVQLEEWPIIMQTVVHI